MINPSSPAALAPAMVINVLTVVRGGVTALDSVSFSAPRGQITGLLGPSGCGKSTLMRAIVGVQIVKSGSVTVLDLPAGSPSLRDRVGYVTQAPSVYDDLTVRENVSYFARILGAGRTWVDHVIAEVDLKPEADRLVRKLSDGQRSRVSLACALLGSPEILVLDEPTVGLDPVLRRDLWDLFRRLADSGVTLLVSSHVMDEAARCDRLLLMRAGHIIADDTPAGLLARTAARDIEQAFLVLVEGSAA